MSKRTKVVIRTREADALRKLRELKSLSVRKVGDLLGISHTLVSHLEIGRANITEEYVSKFLKALNYNEADWKYVMSVPIKNKQEDINFLVQECISRIRNMPEEKLRILKTFISNL